MDRLGGDFPHDLADDHTGYDVGEHDSVHEAPPSPVGQDERRMQVRAYNHWASLLGDRNFPAIEHLDPGSLDDFGPYSVLLDFSVGIDDPAVRYVGAKLAEECGACDAIATLSDVPSRSLLSRITDHYMQILANQAPIGFEAEFVNQHGRVALYRGILLPYSSDDSTIDFIYGVINWKELADQQTADELLLEIGQALGADTAAENAAQDDGDCPVETPEMLTESHRKDLSEDAVLDLGAVGSFLEDNAASEGAGLPLPSFGGGEDDEYDEDEEHDGSTDVEWTPRPPRGDSRGVDALGNPLGHHTAAFDEVDYGAGDEEYDNPIKTAADYGLPEWDDEGEEDDDVDGLVDPLADPATSSSLISLVSRGERAKKTVDLSQLEPGSAVPHAYEGEGVPLPARLPEPYEPAPEPELAVSNTFELEAAETEYADEVSAEVEMEPVAEAIEEPGYDEDDFAPIEALDDPAPVEEPVLELTPAAIEEPAPAIESEDEALPAFDAESPEGLYDCLAAAREMAQTALTTEDRSRKALYSAVGRAYDFSLEAQANAEDFEELMADNGLTVQDRAPMTPIVKLVFGADYDKTRLTEYAAVLTHAHRLQLERGTLTGFLRSAEGGLKGVLNAERRARKEEQGKTVDEAEIGIRPSLAKKLRKLDPVDYGDIAADGAEFALVMVRRTPDGELVVLGEVPDDVPLVEKAARKLLG